jgi:hypothetical protein
MDSQRFDELTKAFAVRRSRRVVLRTALGSMGAGLLGLVGGTGASAKGARKFSDQGPVPCGEIEGLECSDGFTCVEGFCLDDDGPALAVGASCSDDAQCIDSRCFNGHCRAGVGVGEDFDPLGEDFDPLGEDFDPLAGAPTLCGQGLSLTVCRSGEFCCNESCGICAPIGGSCTQEFCSED